MIFEVPGSKNRAPAARRARFYKNRLSKLTLIFDPILVPTWLHFGIQNPLKSTQKSIPRGIRKMIDFCIDVWPSWLQFGNQVGAMLATFSEKMGGAKLSGPIFLLRWIFFISFQTNFKCWISEEFQMLDSRKISNIECQI